MADEIFYTCEVDGERQDLECKTANEVREWADNWFAEKCQESDYPLRNGQTFSDEAVLIKYSVNDDGEETELEREKMVLEYEHYHGDYAEHNTHWGLR